MLLSHDHPLNVWWIDPVRTPAIERISYILRRGTLRATIGGSIIVFPLLYARSIASDQRFFLVVEIVALLLTAGTILFVGIVPQVWLARIVRREKERILSRLFSTVSDRSELDRTDSVARLESIELYRTVSQARDAPVGVGPLVQYAARSWPSSHHTSRSGHFDEPGVGRPYRTGRHGPQPHRGRAVEHVYPAVGILSRVVLSAFQETGPAFLAS